MSRSYGRDSSGRRKCDIACRDGNRPRPGIDVEAMYTLCSQFAICSFAGSGAVRIPSRLSEFDGASVLSSNAPCRPNSHLLPSAQGAATSRSRPNGSMSDAAGSPVVRDARACTGARSAMTIGPAVTPAAGPARPKPPLLARLAKEPAGVSSVAAEAASVGGLVHKMLSRYANSRW